MYVERDVTHVRDCTPPASAVGRDTSAPPLRGGGSRRSRGSHVALPTLAIIIVRRRHRAGGRVSPRGASGSAPSTSAKEPVAATTREPNCFSADAYPRMPAGAAPRTPPIELVQKRRQDETAAFPVRVSLPMSLPYTGILRARRNFLRLCALRNACPCSPPLIRRHPAGASAGVPPPGDERAPERRGDTGRPALPSPPGAARPARVDSSSRPWRRGRARGVAGSAAGACGARGYHGVRMRLLPALALFAALACGGPPAGRTLERGGPVITPDVWHAP